MSTPATFAIQAESLEKSYRLNWRLGKSVRALKGLNLSVGQGEIFGLIGPNGAGKSTTIKILLDLVRASKGKAQLFGIDARDRRSREGLGYVPENPAPYDYLSGREFVTLSARLSGLSGGELTRRVGESLERVGLAAAADLRIRRYSKGMTQRTVLAAALVNKPRLLVLDEPTSGLDPIGRRLVRDVILEERKRNTTVLFCTHIISDVETLCDRLAVLVAGQAVKEGTVASLLSGETQRVEVLMAGIEGEQVGQLPGVTSVTNLGQRTLLTVNETDLNPLIAAIMAKQGQVLRITPIRFSLEELFLQTLQGVSAPSVGSYIE